MKNKSHLTILNLVKAVTIGEILGFRNKTLKADFPSEIGNYKFQKVFSKKEIKSKMFVFALYENKKGEKALAKMWRGSIKEFVYYTLLNEIAVYKTLNKVLKRLAKSIPEEFKNIRIPKYIGAIQDKKSLLILTEYIEEASADKIMSHNAFEICKKCADFLRFLGSKMTKKEKEGISRRTILDIFLLYPLLLIRTIIIRPRLFGTLIKGLPLVASSLPAFFKKREISLGHRDLQPKNILIAKGGIYIVDLQFCIFSYELYDLFTTLRACFNDKSFRNRIIREITRRLLQGEDKNWIQGLMIICATHGLSGNNLPKRIEKKYINFLYFALKDNHDGIRRSGILHSLRFNR